MTRPRRIRIDVGVAWFRIRIEGTQMDGVTCMAQDRPPKIFLAFDPPDSILVISRGWGGPSTEDGKPETQMLGRRVGGGLKICGGLALTGKAVDLKSTGPKGLAGSNPAPSAIFLA
jgi:hypothetical protein